LLNDFVAIQEFRRQPNADIRQLLTAFTDNGWAYVITADEGGPTAGRGCYLVVWNPTVLRLEAGPEFVTGYSKAPQAQPLQTSSGRTIKTPERFDPMRAQDNPPLATRFRHIFADVPVHAYTWHVTPTSAAARVDWWPTYGLAAPGGAAGQALVTNALSASRIVDDMQKAVDREAIWILAGDLNVKQSVLKRGTPPDAPPFPASRGFNLVSGGGTGLDHIVALYSANPISMRARHPGAQLGTHAPLACTI
jgi:hypothetical protein